MSINVCSCETTEIRRRTKRGGVVVYVRQCLQCGAQVGSEISKAHPDIVRLATCEPFDDDLVARVHLTRQAVVEERQRQQVEADDAWWDTYNAYLRTAAWAERRAKVLKRDNYLCQACLSARATEAHHLTYKHVGREPLFELVAVCATCHHEWIHAKERAE
jgi:5-methylcytosine-specific restriction endonuclease McrA